ncbi:MAG: ATP12 family chaperone protein, partial [Parvularcula sp.]|nr:ATP12 family chaperone protein [Parvularcula sp.]
MTAPQRFYREVSLLKDGDRYKVQLDGRTAKTVGRQDLSANHTLAEALREEWDRQDKEIRLDSMPLTRLHGFALDAGNEGRAEFIETILQYAGSDLLCYRAEVDDLAARQEEAFAPFLSRAEEEELRFHHAAGLVPITQPDETIRTLRLILERKTTSEIFARKLLTEILGSAILALYAEND